MADNNYAIPPNFPVGCLMAQLKEEMVSVWSGDVFPISMIHRGKPGTGGVITAGVLQIVTQRVLTGPEDAAALAHFQTHVPVIGAQGGVLTAALGAGAFQGDQRYVTDQARNGGGTGVICYWDGTDRTWRRIRDDAVVAVIP